MQLEIFSLWGLLVIKEDTNYRLPFRNTPLTLDDYEQRSLEKAEDVQSQLIQALSLDYELWEAEHPDFKLEDLNFLSVQDLNQAYLEALDRTYLQ